MTLECIYEGPGERGAVQEQRDLDFTWYINTRDHSRISESYDSGLTTSLLDRSLKDSEVSKPADILKTICLPSIARYYHKW